MLDDFNARVGSRLEDDLWWNERDPRGYGDLNEVGRELLTFLSINRATICNTGTDCSTDHRMVRMKMDVGRRRYYRRMRADGCVKRWDVAKLQGGCDNAALLASTSSGAERMIMEYRRQRSN